MNARMSELRTMQAAYRSQLNASDLSNDEFEYVSVRLAEINEELDALMLASDSVDHSSTIDALLAEATEIDAELSIVGWLVSQATSIRDYIRQASDLGVTLDPTATTLHQTFDAIVSRLNALNSAIGVQFSYDQYRSFQGLAG